MKRETYISIPQPCHENWNGMTPQDKGRFCASCAKTVIDFSTMSDTQILRYLSQTKGGLCGRFAQNQIERPLVATQIAKKKIWWMAALMPLTLLLSKVNGQLFNKKTNKIEYNKIEQSMGLVAVKTHNTNNVVQSNNTKLITGVVTGNNHVAIPYASISLKGTTIGTTTDSSGKFCLSFPEQASSATITITAVGYEAKEITCTKELDGININLQTLSLTPATQGDVVVITGYAVKRRPVKNIDTVKTTIRKILHTNIFSVYPSPAVRGAEVHVTVKKKGIYMIQLLDANSKLITYKLFDAADSKMITALTIPSSTAAGIYFIRLINEATNQQFTDKIMVQ